MIVTLQCRSMCSVSLYGRVRGPPPQEEMGDLPDIVHMPNCCGEFVVSRQRVRARPRAFYQNALDIMEARAPPAVPEGPSLNFSSCSFTAYAAGASRVLCGNCSAIGHRPLSWFCMLPLLCGIALSNQRCTHQRGT